MTIEIDSSEVKRLAGLGLSRRQVARGIGLSESGFRKKLAADPQLASAFSNGEVEHNGQLPPALQRPIVATYAYHLGRRVGLSLDDLCGIAAEVGGDPAKYPKWLIQGNETANLSDVAHRLYKRLFEAGAIETDCDGNRPEVTMGKMLSLAPPGFGEVAEGDVEQGTRQVSVLRGHVAHVKDIPANMTDEEATEAIQAGDGCFRAALTNAQIAALPTLQDAIAGVPDWRKKSIRALEGAAVQRLPINFREPVGHQMMLRALDALMGKRS